MNTPLAALHPGASPRRAGGFTLIELMIVVAVLGVIAALAAPSFRKMIVDERLRGIHAQLVTDLNFARTEAVSRGRYVDFRLYANSSTTCYIIFERPSVGVGQSGGTACNCLTTPRCSTASGFQEIRTVSLPRADGITVTDQGLGSRFHISIEPRTGAIFVSAADLGSTLPPGLAVNTSTTDGRSRLRANMALSGQVSSCVPSGSDMKGTPC